LDATDGPEAVMALYGERINRHRFDELAPLISEEASFWFSEGSFTGPAIRRAFERTWDLVRDEHYWLDELRWIALGPDAASCIYRFNWRGEINGAPTQGHGRGTTVLRREPAGWKIVHEHLSREA